MALSFYNKLRHEKIIKTKCYDIIRKYVIFVHKHISVNEHFEIYICYNKGVAIKYH